MSLLICLLWPCGDRLPSLDLYCAARIIGTLAVVSSFGLTGVGGTNIYGVVFEAVVKCKLLVM